jgi:hypothetical protein
MAMGRRRWPPAVNFWSAQNHHHEFGLLGLQMVPVIAFEEILKPRMAEQFVV